MLTYSRLFRPWDGPASKQQENGENGGSKKAGRRGGRDAEQNHQDSTISTTTGEEEELNQRLGVGEQDSKTADCGRSSEELNQRLGVVVPEQDSKTNHPTYQEVMPHHHHHPIQQVPPYADYAQPLLFPSDPALLDAFAQGYALELEYARLVHDEHQSKLAQSSRKQQRPKRHRCPHCHVAFSNNGQLKGHVRIHTGERPYKCDDRACGKTFTRNEELTRHRRIHSGLRPYACATCGKKFGRRDHLKKHARTHLAHVERALAPMFVPLPMVGVGVPPSAYPYVYGY